MYAPTIRLNNIQSTLRRFYVAIVLLCFCSCAFAQDVVQGKVVDDKTSEPIPFATIKLMKPGSLVAGVVSNTDGGFGIPSKVLDSADSLTVSCIGYANFSISVLSFLKTKSLEIRLKEGSTLLNEVIVKAKKGGARHSANEIIKLAIENVSKNYPSQPFSYVAYYRDYQKENSEYVNLNEAVIKVFDQGFQSNDFDSTRITLYEYRQNASFRRDSSAEIPYDNKGSKFIPTAKLASFGGNELSILRIHDAIRNYGTKSYSFVDQFDQDFIKNHVFQLLGTIPSGDTFLYRISFQSNREITGPDHESAGEIFVEPRTYGIHRLVYKTFRKEGDKKDLLYSADVEYSRDGGFLYLNYISFNNFFNAKTDLGFKVVDVTFDRDISAFVITFNRPPSIPTVTKVDNYNFKFDGKPIIIDRVQVSDIDNKQIKLFVSSIDLNWSIAEMASKFEVTFKNIKDEAGREINTDVFKRVSQFRELFLQKLTPQADQSGDDLFIDKEVSLRDGPIDESVNRSGTVWMNTPLKND